MMGDKDNVVSRDERNPYHDWNHVYLKYCSGDTWTGTNEKRPGAFSLYFSGFNNILATVAALRRHHNFDAASDLVFAGSSAGAIGVNNNCDFMAALLEGVNVRCVSVSGLFFPRGTNALWLDRIGVGNLTAEIGSFYVTTLFNSHLDESCLLHAREHGDPGFLCWNAAYLVPHIGTKIFFAQNMWDSIQIRQILCRKDIHYARCPEQFLYDFKRNTIETVGPSSVVQWLCRVVQLAAFRTDRPRCPRTRRRGLLDTKLLRTRAEHVRPDRDNRQRLRAWRGSPRSSSVSK